MRNLLSGLLSLFAMNSTVISFLQKARELETPAALTTDAGESEASEFWNQNGELIRKAWLEWEEGNVDLPILDESVYNPALREAVKVALQDPTQEDDIRRHFDEVSPGVYKCQLLQPDRIADIRAYIDAVGSSGIPTRRPNGMNRYGIILDPRTEGSVALSGLNRFYEDLVDDYVRPLGRLWFPEYMQAQDDAESYAFTIRYKGGEDLALREHSDASLVTLNVNLNVPGRSNETSYSGSTLYFVDEATGNHQEVQFEPGMAVLHRGLTRHAAQPIRQGERTNMVVWLFGEHGYVRFVPYEERERMSRQKRWTKPDAKTAAMRGIEL